MQSFSRTLRCRGPAAPPLRPHLKSCATAPSPHCQEVRKFKHPINNNLLSNFKYMSPSPRLIIVFAWVNILFVDVKVAWEKENYKRTFWLRSWCSAASDSQSELQCCKFTHCTQWHCTVMIRMPTLWVINKHSVSKH